jgi:predicted O-methyltransferase YrrM
VKVVVGDALRVLPLLRGPVDFLLIDAKKDDYLDYLRAVEPRLLKGALIVADNTGMYRRDVKPYLDHVRESGHYQSREHDFGFDCMEVSIYRG